MQRRRVAMISFLFVLLLIGAAVLAIRVILPIPEIVSPALPPPRISTHEQANWQASVLSHFQEPSMTSLPTTVDESYRFIIEPSFHHPISIRLVRHGDQAELTTKILDSVGTYEKGKVVKEEAREISGQEWSGLLRLLDNLSFWTLPTDDPSEPLILDGATWSLEGFDQATYHVTSRVWPDKDYTEVCRYMLQLSGHESEYTGYSESY